MYNATVFISHSSKDELISRAFSSFLIHVGIPESHILCSSQPGTHIRAGELLYPALRHALDRRNVLFIALLSDNYYSSAVCLNEMGAAWVKKHECFEFILPGFSFESVKGVIKENEQVGVSLSTLNEMTDAGFGDLKKKLKKRFRISNDAELWERERNIFYQSVKQYENECLNTIPMEKAEGFCIEQYIHDGCAIKERQPSKIIADVNFAMTEARLCSIVFSPHNHNWVQLAERKKCLCFSAYSNMKFVNAEIELKICSNFGTPLSSKKYPLVITDKVTDYSIPLLQFSTSPSDFTYTHEICFLFLRDNMPTTGNPIKITIENLTVGK